MSTQIHLACHDCREHHCIGQMAKDETGEPWLNVYAGQQGHLEDATDTLGLFLIKHMGHCLQTLRDEVVFDAMYAKFDWKV